MNRARGEVQITLNGEQSTHCLTLGASARIEGRTGKTLAELLAAFGAGVPLATVLVILEETATDPADSARFADLPIDMDELAPAVLDILKASGLLSDSGKKPGKPRRQA
jgi:hypothetical protein